MEFSREIGLKFPQSLESPFLKMSTTLAFNCSSVFVNFPQCVKRSLKMFLFTSESSLKNSIGISSGPGDLFRLNFLSTALSSSLVIRQVL